MSVLPRLVERTLIVIIVFLVFIITATTVWVFRDGGAADARVPAANAVATAVDAVIEQSFTGIGRMRAVLHGERGGDGSTVIIRVVFPYDASDAVFTEELAKNIGFFRETVSAYFAAMTAADPRLHDETAMKAELLEQFNAHLRLGSIDRLFFSEFLIID
jgi:flagellar basal body-associated protein FliL